MVTKAKRLVDELQGTSPLLAHALTKGDGFPAIDAELASFRNAFDWGAAKAEGRVVPTENADPDYDRAKVRVTGSNRPRQGTRRKLWQR